MATTYHHPVGAVLGHSLPGLLREGRALDEPPEPAWQLTQEGRAAEHDLPSTAHRQRRALAALRERPLTASELAALEVTSATLARLAAKSWIEPATLPARGENAPVPAPPASEVGGQLGQRRNG